MIEALSAISRMNKKELIEFRKTIDSLINDEIEPLVKKLAIARQKLLAVKIVKSIYNIGLGEAKDKVDSIIHKPL